MYEATVKIFLQEILDFSCIMCVFWRKSLEIIQYDMERSVQINVLST